jgi:MYXO-CTERM domain-containing protein
MKAPLFRFVRLVVGSAAILTAALAGCSVPALDEEQPQLQEACDLEPQTLAPAAALEIHDHGDENIGTTSEALSSLSCNMSSTTGYTSGNSFSIKVVTIDGKKVEWKTANAYMEMAKAAAKSGVQIRIVSGFRSMSEQQYLYGCYVNCSCNGCNLAAKPGYSNHQSGHALDLNTSAPGVYSWLSKNAGKFGFKRTVPSEAWHWEWWGNDDGQGPCNGKTLKAKLAKKSSNAKRFRGKNANYIVCADKPFKFSFTFKNKGSATWRDVDGRGKTLGSDVFLVTASGKKDKLTGKTRFSLKNNANKKVRGDRKAKNCSNKNGCRKTTFIKGGIQAKAPKKPGVYTTKWRLRDYSKLHGKTSKGFGPKAQLKFKVVDCSKPKACGCTVWCTDGSKKKVAADKSSAQCKSVGETMCAPAKYLAHHFTACEPPPPPSGTGGTSGGTGGTSSSTGGTSSSTGGTSSSTGGTSSSTGGSGGTAGDTGGGDPGGPGGDPATDPTSDPDFDGTEDEAGIEPSESATSGAEEPDDEDYGEEDGFDGDEEGVSRGGVEEASGCSVAGRPGSGAGSVMGLGSLALLGLAGAWRIARRRAQR